jgi:hypothetical protein
MGSKRRMGTKGGLQVHPGAEQGKGRVMTPSIKEMVQKLLDYAEDMDQPTSSMGDEIVGRAMKDAAALIERLAGALEEIAGDDLYMRHWSTWNDGAKLERGMKEFARAALSGEPTP